MLINSESVPKTIQLLDTKSFYSTINSIIFKNMVELFEKNKNIDYISLTEQLKKGSKPQGFSSSINF